MHFCFQVNPAAFGALLQYIYTGRCVLFQEPSHGPDLDLRNLEATFSSSQAVFVVSQHALSCWVVQVLWAVYFKGVWGRWCIV